MKKLLSFTLLCFFLAAMPAVAQLERPQSQQENAAGRFAIEGAATPNPVAPSPAVPSPAVPPSNISANPSIPALGKSIPADAELTHPKSHVLLIGVTQYPTSEPSTDSLKSIRFSNLNFCVKDMEGLADALVQARFCRAGDIQILLSGAGGTNEPTARNVETAMRNMLANVKQGDRVLVAFSGHGISLPEGGRTVDFLCATDSKTAFDTTTGKYSIAGLVRRSTLEEMLDASEAEIKLVFIDACRNVLDFGEGDITEEGGSDPGVKGLGDVRGAGTFGKGVASDIQNQGFFRFSSCEPGQVSWEFSSQRHGAFTYFLIKGMLGDADDRGRGVITLADLQSYVRKETQKYVTYNNKVPTQIPVVWRSPEARITENDVLFSFFTPLEGGSWRVEQSAEGQQAALAEIDGVLYGPQRNSYSQQDLSRINMLRQELSTSFSPQGYQYATLAIADMRMQSERAFAEAEWIRLNPPPRSRDGLRIAGAIAGQFAPYGGYISAGTQLAASGLERRDQAAYARRVAVMREQLAVFSLETGSARGFVQAQDGQRSASQAQRTTNSATLSELNRQISTHQRQPGYQALVNDIARLRNDVNRVDVTSQIADLEQRVESFLAGIAEQEQRRIAEQRERRVANEAKLAELEALLKQNENQTQNYRYLMSRITNARTSNERGMDLSSQIPTLERDIERFVAAPGQPASVQQQQRQPTTTPPRGVMGRR